MADTVAGARSTSAIAATISWSGLRLGPDRANHVVFYSSTWGGRAPLERMNGRLYLIAFYDEDHDGRMENGEYEFIILDFDPSLAALALAVSPSGPGRSRPKPNVERARIQAATDAS